MCCGRKNSKKPPTPRSRKIVRTNIKNKKDSKN